LDVKYIIIINFLNNSHLLLLLAIVVILHIYKNKEKIVNEHYGHVITGDLNIIKDYSLRYFMSLGTKYRLPSKFNIPKIISQFDYDLDLFIYNTAIAYNKPVAFFSEWKDSVLFHHKILLNKNKSHLVKLKNNSLKNKIKQLQDNFIITYVDKSANNYAFICKSLSAIAK